MSIAHRAGEPQVSQWGSGETEWGGTGVGWLQEGRSDSNHVRQIPYPVAEAAT